MKYRAVQATDITIALYLPEDEYTTNVTTEWLIWKLTNNELQWYGEVIHSTNGKPIIALCPKEETHAPR